MRVFGNRAQPPRQPEAEITSSRLFPEALIRLEKRQPEQFTVVDLGAGHGDTVNCFQTLGETLESRVRVHFCDAGALYEQTRQLEEAPEHATWLHLWQQQLALPATEQIDVLLLWDFLHYFSTEAIDALSTTLQPHIGTDTRGYGFGTLRPGHHLPRRRYGLQSTTAVSSRPVNSGDLPHAHSQKGLAEAFVTMHIARSTLLHEGHLELLFEP